MKLWRTVKRLVSYARLPWKQASYPIAHEAIRSSLRESLQVRKDHAYGWQPIVISSPGDLMDIKGESKKSQIDCVVNSHYGNEVHRSSANYRFPQRGFLAIGIKHALGVAIEARRFAQYSMSFL
jgi:hypothetical protein